jgi:CheY-like chemotaxis protein
MIVNVGNRGYSLRCNELGIKCYLSTPFSRSELFTTIKLLIDNTRNTSGTFKDKLITKHLINESRVTEAKILLAEDYPTNQKLALIYLKSLKCETDLAVNGEEAVKAFRQKDYDLIFMDIQMPVMDGLEATRKIRAIEKELSESSGYAKGKIPIVAVTANAMQGDREKCIAAGMDDYITKPLKKKDLLEMIDKWEKLRRSL